MLAPEFRVYAFIAAIVLAVMALSFVVFKGDATCCSSGECGHGLSRLATGKVLTFLVLLAPIAVAARFNPRDGFSKSFVENRGITTQPPLAEKKPGLVSKLLDKWITSLSLAMLKAYCQLQ